MACQGPTAAIQNSIPALCLFCNLLHTTSKLSNLCVLRNNNLFTCALLSVFIFYILGSYILCVGFLYLLLVGYYLLLVEFLYFLFPVLIFVIFSSYIFHFQFLYFLFWVLIFFKKMCSKNCMRVSYFLFQLPRIRCPCISSLLLSCPLRSSTDRSPLT